jgi:hypothetical protein
MPLDESFETAMKDPSVGGTLFNHMRVLFDLCVVVSLVIALYTQRFTNGLIRRDHLTAVSLSI